jgi:4-hydroxy-tetrahydrodipicolinate synthase
VLELAKNHSNITAVKEASGDLNQVMEILKNKDKDFHVLSGDDALTFPMIGLGAKGVISVVANAFPAEFSSMVKQSLDGNFSEARKIHYSLLEIINQLFADGNPAVIKAALSILNICDNNLRLPLVPVSDKHFSELETLMKSFNL